MDYIDGEAKNCSRNFLNAFQSDKGHKCPPTYHIFKKPVKSKDKIIHRWYYYFFDPVVCEIYAEATFHEIPYIPCPAFPNFIRNSKKKSLSKLYSLLQVQ